MIYRSDVKKAKSKAKSFFTEQKNLGKKSRIYKISKDILRTDNFIIDYNTSFRCLDNINFIYDQIHRHWAETDGKGIELNTWKTFTDKLLTDTLIHEALHGIVLRDSKHTIPEEKEHRIMELIDPDLI